MLARTIAIKELMQIKWETILSSRKASRSVDIEQFQEVFVAVQKLSTVVSLADVKAKIAQSSAATMAAAATTKLNAAIAANPIGAIIIGVMLLVLALVALEAKFGLVTRAVDGLKDGFEMLADLIDRVYGSLQGVTIAAAELGDALSFGPVSGVLNTLGGR